MGRFATTSDDGTLSVHIVTGARTVLLDVSAPNTDALVGCLGFAICREGGGTGSVWLNGSTGGEDAHEESVPASMPEAAFDEEDALACGIARLDIGEA